MKSRNLRKKFDLIWGHQMDIMKEMAKVSGTFDVEMGIPHTRVHWEEPNYQCAFEEMERERHQ
jgi:hypothetical protein